MKKKIIMFLFALLFLPGVMLFSGCGKDKVKVNGFKVYIDDVIYSQNNNTIHLDYGDTVAWKDLITVKKTFSNGEQEEILEKTAISDGYTMTVTLETQSFGADTYTIVISYEDFDSVTISLIVDRLSVAKPTAIAGLVFNGTEQTGVNYLTDAGYTVTGISSATNAGEYSATFTLNDNYKWVDGSTEPLVIYWTIGKKQVEIPTVKTGLIYNGEVQLGVNYLTDAGYTVTGNVSGIDADNYLATFTLDVNHKWADGTTDPVMILWHIDKKSVLVPQVMSMPYNGNKQTSLIIENEYYTVADNGGVDVNEYEAILTLKDSDNYYFDGDSTKLNETKTIKYNIVQATNILSGELSMAGWIYKDAISTPNTNGLELLFGDKADLIYTYHIDSKAETDPLELDSNSNAGVYYLKATLPATKNYTEVSIITSFEILRRDNSLTSGITLEDYQYTGLVPNPSATAEFSEVTFKYFIDSECTNEIDVDEVINVGTYFVKAYVTAQSTNYNAFESEAKSFTISKATNQISTIQMSGWTYKDVVISQPKADSMFGEVKYAYYSDEDCINETAISSLTDAGTYYVKAYVEETANYSAISTAISFVIEKKDNSFVAQATIEGWEYKGTISQPSAEVEFGEIEYLYYSDPECTQEITLSVNLDANTYYMVAKVEESSNYNELISAPVSFVIAKATNNFLSDFEDVVSWQYSQEPNMPSIDARFGSVTIKYYADEDCEDEIAEPTNTLSVGTYYAKAFVEGTDNYEGLESDVIVINVNKMEIRNIPSAQNVNLTYNESEQKLVVDNFDESIMSIEGDIATDHGNYSATITLNSNYEFYEYGNTITIDWCIEKLLVEQPELDGASSFEYTGSEQAPSIKNFNEKAFELVEGSVFKATNVGDYTISYKLNNNYRWSHDEDIISLNWTITKKLISAPAGNNIIYTEEDGLFEDSKVIVYEEEYITVVDYVYDFVNDVEYITTQDIAGVTDPENPNYLIFKLLNPDNCDWVLTDDIITVNFEEEIYLVYTWHVIERNPFESITLTNVLGESRDLSLQELFMLTEVEFGSVLNLCSIDGLNDSEYTFDNNGGFEFLILDEEGTPIFDTIINPNIVVDSAIKSINVGDQTYTYSKFKEIESIDFGQIVTVTLEEAYLSFGYRSNYAEGLEFDGTQIKIEFIYDFNLYTPKVKNN